MLATGHIEPQYIEDTNKASSEASEILNFRNSHVYCKNLEEYPLNLDNAVGANYKSIPIVCGGLFNYPFYDASGHCYFYKEKKWQPFLQMVEPRARAAAIMYNNTFHIFGGTKGFGKHRMQSSEVIDDFR